MKLKEGSLRLYAVTDRSWAPDTAGLLKQVEEAIAHYDNVVIMKAGGSIGRILELMKKYDRAESCATVISCVGMKDEYIGSLDPERTYSYFTTVIIKREKR